MKILLVLNNDDEAGWNEKMGRGLRQALQQMGHAVLLAIDDETLKTMLQRRPDLILVAPDLIEIEGRRLFDRQAKGPLPLLMPLPTFEQQEPSTTVAEETGSARPSIYLRLASRITRRLRRLTRRTPPRIRVGYLVIHFEEKRILFHQQPLQVTPIQFRLLGALALQVGHVLSPGELLESVWGYEADDAEARELLKVHIRRLRQKLHAISPDGADYIQSVRGFGYRLAPPDTE